MRYWLDVTLKSDAAFSIGQGVPGLVDVEVDHDPFGLPVVRGRSLKGLLVEECANLLFALKRQGAPSLPDWEAVAALLFGRPGSSPDSSAHLHVGRAELPTDLRAAVAADVKAGRLQAADVLESLTTIRTQTAIDLESGAPATGSLRSLRLVLRDTVLHAPLIFDPAPSSDALALLAACAAAVRRGGLGRNRGRGRLTLQLRDDSGPVGWERFTASLRGQAS